MINVNQKMTDFWVGLHLPTLPIQATNGKEITLAESVEHRIYGPVVVYCYSQIKLSDISEVGGGIQQAYAFRDRFQEFKKLGITIYGLSTEDIAYQKEVVQRLVLPFDLLSDSDLAVSDTLVLPRFRSDGKFFLKHMTFIIEKDRVVKIFDPVTVPEKNAEDVLTWFYNRRI